ncbi:MAG: hypothetical protein Q9195_000698 [Heterodermia aff. obscurata]
MEAFKQRPLLSIGFIPVCLDDRHLLGRSHHPDLLQLFRGKVCGPCLSRQKRLPTQMSTLAPPHPSPLAARLFNIDGITSVFYGPDFITVTKAEDTNWAHVKPEVFSLITEAVTSGEAVVNIVENKGSEAGQEGGEKDTLQYDDNDSEVISMIKELLDTRIRPAIQDDGGDIEFRGFENGHVLLKLRGACRTCDSSTVTLKNGIESMLMHYIEEVQGVTQVLDQEEEIAMKEFARFEERLNEKKGSQAAGSTIG